MRKGYLLWIGFLVLVSVLYGAYEFEAIFRLHRFKDFWGMDLKGGYLVEAAILQSGDWAAIWDPEINKAWQQTHGFPGTFPNSVYPPLMALVFVPMLGPTLGELSDRFAIFNACLTFSLGLGLGWWMLPGRKPLLRWGIAVVMGLQLLLSAPSQINLIHGQTGVLLTALCAAFALLYLQGRPYWGTLALSLAISLKLYPAAMLWPVLARRDYKTIAFAILTCLAFNGLVWFYVGNAWWDLYYGFLKILRSLPNTTIDNFTDQSLLGVMGRYLGPGLGGVPATLAGLTILGLSFWKSQGPLSPRQQNLAFSMGCFAQLLCIGRSWHCYHTTLWLALALYARGQTRLDTARTTWLVTLMWPIAMWDSDLAVSAGLWRWWLMDSGVFCFLMAVMWALMWHDLQNPDRVQKNKPSKA